MGKYATKKRTGKKWILWVILALVCVSAAAFVTKFLLEVFHKPKISVIIPVYKVENYLDKCLESVENQTFKDIEIICVNDGSPDGCLKILENHAKKDKRIKIISQKNQGISMARNAGLNVAKGEYVYFLDSDDMIACYAMEKALAAIEKYDAEVVEFQCKSYQDGEYIDYKNYPYEDLGEEVIESKEGQNPLEAFNSGPIVWNKLWKRSTIEENNIRFAKDVNMGEDELFNWITLQHVQKFVRDNNVYHFYLTNRQTSIMNTDFKITKKRLNSYLLIAQELSNNRYRFSFEGRDQYLINIMLSLIYDRIYNMLKEDKEQGEYARIAVHLIDDNFVKKYSTNIDDASKKQIDNLKKLAKNL